MAIRNIVQMDDEIIRKKSKPVKEFDEDLWVLLDDMKDSMNAANGMGIAAVQVGVLRRAVLIECNRMFVELINPRIIKQEGESIAKEGCLSVDRSGIRELVKRPMKVTVEAVDRMGYPFTLTGEDMLARVICHELDHLDGILFVDKIYKKK